MERVEGEFEILEGIVEALDDVAGDTLGSEEGGHLRFALLEEGVPVEGGHRVRYPHLGAEGVGEHRIHGRRGPDRSQVDECDLGRVCGGKSRRLLGGDRCCGRGGGRGGREGGGRAAASGTGSGDQGERQPDGRPA